MGNPNSKNPFKSNNGFLFWLRIRRAIIERGAGPRRDEKNLPLFGGRINQRQFTQAEAD
jgi:hypothetical protein